MIRDLTWNSPKPTVLGAAKVRPLRGLLWTDFASLLNRHGYDSEFQDRVDDLTRETKENVNRSKQESDSIGMHISATTIEEPPLFVIGHWRSGTTLLQFILSQDPNFAFLSRHHALNPYSTTAKSAVPRGRKSDRAIDGVLVNADSPGEDEFAIAARSVCSPYIGYSFPKSADYYDRFISLSDVTDVELQHWTDAFLWTSRKATLFGNRRRLILKSPSHTGRIGHLLKIFPKAQFVHIHRQPEAVMRSIYALNRNHSIRSYLERPTDEQLRETIIRRYNMLFDAFFKDVGSVAEGNIATVSFEQLETDPMLEIRKIYQTLNIPFTTKAEKSISGYIASISGYRKNNHPELPKEVSQEILGRISFNTVRLGYKS